MDTNTRKLNLPAIAFALAALAATHPAAVLAERPHSEKVLYGDLNLASEDGVAVLDRRLDRAVERVCGEASIRDVAAQRRIEACREETRQSIEDDRELAIGKATGQNVRRAEQASRNRRG